MKCSRTHTLFVKSRARSARCSGLSDFHTRVWGHHYSFLHNFTRKLHLSSLAKCPNQCCKLSLKSAEGSGFIIYNIIKITTVTLQRIEDYRTVQRQKWPTRKWWKIKNGEQGIGNRGLLEAKCFRIADATVWRSVMTTVFDCYENLIPCWHHNFSPGFNSLNLCHCLLVPRFGNLTLYKTGLKQVIGSCLKSVNDMCLERFSKNLSELHLCEA